MKYRGVVIEGDHVSGERSYDAGDGERWVRFSGTTDLMRIHHVIDVAPPGILAAIWEMQDGMPGLALKDYDWSAIRDSSAEAKGRMHAFARQWFRRKYGLHAQWPWDVPAAKEVPVDV